MPSSSAGSAMPCPQCQTLMKVRDTRFRENGYYVWRRRECKECGHRVTTREEIVPSRAQRLPDTTRAAIQKRLDQLFEASYA